MQVREQSCWFWSAPEGGPTAADIRAGLGDFDHIRCVAKFTTRVGQCFSSTVDTLKLLARTCCVCHGGSGTLFRKGTFDSIHILHCHCRWPGHV